MGLIKPDTRPIISENIFKKRKNFDKTINISKVKQSTALDEIALRDDMPSSDDR
jgi:hypothetical protein